MGIKITQPLKEPLITPELVNEWFHQALGFEIPIDAHEFKFQADMYGINWLGLLVLALIDTDYFRAPHFKEKNSLMGNNKTFFSSKEAVIALAQQVGAFGGSPYVKKSCPYLFVLPSSLATRDSSMFGSHWYFQELTGDPKHFEKLYGTIQTYCLKIGQLDLDQPVTLAETSEVPQPASVSPKKFQVLPLLRFGLKTLWVLALKFFPWLGWLSFVVYNLIDLLVK